MATTPIKIGIQGDASNLSRALKKAGGEVAGFAKKVGKLGIQAGAAFTGAAVAVGVQGVRAAADFESAMNEVMTLLPDASENVFGELSDQVKNFSKEFGVLPNEVIPSLYQALSAGVPQENVFEFLEVAQKAAKGGVTDLETAVDGISSVVNSYGADVITATEASDMMFTAVRLGKTNFEELSGSLFQVAPIAASLGIGFGEVTASLANLTAKGVPTSVAATQLKAAFSELGKEGTKASDMFKELSGQSMQEFLAEGHGLEGVLEVLKIGSEETGVSLLDMFGSIEAGQAVLGLAGDGMSDFFDTMYEMNTSAGATEAAFETMDQGLSANFDKIKANLAVLSIEIGQKLAPVIAKASGFIVNHFDDIVRIAGDVRDKAIEIAQKTWPVLVKIFNKTVDLVRKHVIPVFEGIVDVSKRVIKFVKDNADIFIVLGAALAGALAGLKLWQAGLAVYTGVQKIATAVGTAFNAMMALNPIMIVVIALAALAAAIVVAYQRSEEFQEIVHKVFDFLKDIFVPIWDIVSTAAVIAFETIVDMGKILWEQIQDLVRLVKAIFEGDFSEAFKILGDMAKRSLDAIFTLFIELPAKLITEVVPKMLSALWSIIDGPMKDFREEMFNQVDKVFGFFKSLPGRLGGLITDFAKKGVDIGKGLINGIAKGVREAAGFVGDFAANLGNAIIDFFNIKVIDWINDKIPDKIGMPGPIPDINLPDNPLPRIPNFAEGGIVTGEMLAVLGDNPSGTEAIVPLEKAGDMGFGGTTINLTVNAGLGTNGQQVGAEIISALKNWQRSNGAIPITTS